MNQELTIATKEALVNGANEIERLRRENELLAIKAQAFDAFVGTIALLSPRPNQGYAPDAVWILRRLLAKIEADENATKLGGAPTPAVPDGESA